MRYIGSVLFREFPCKFRGDFVELVVGDNCACRETPVEIRACNCPDVPSGRCSPIRHSNTQAEAICQFCRFQRP